MKLSHIAFLIILMLCFICTPGIMAVEKEKKLSKKEYYQLLETNLLTHNYKDLISGLEQVGKYSSEKNRWKDYKYTKFRIDKKSSYVFETKNFIKFLEEVVRNTEILVTAQKIPFAYKNVGSYLRSVDNNGPMPRSELTTRLKYLPRISSTYTVHVEFSQESNKIIDAIRLKYFNTYKKTSEMVHAHYLKKQAKEEKEFQARKAKQDALDLAKKIKDDAAKEVRRKKYEADRVAHKKAIAEALARRQKIKDDKAAAIKKIADDRAAREKQIADNKVALEKRVAQETVILDTDFRVQGYTSFHNMSLLEFIEETQKNGGLGGYINAVLGCVPSLKESKADHYTNIRITQVLDDGLLYNCHYKKVSFAALIEKEEGKIYQQRQSLGNVYLVFKGMYSYGAVTGAKQTIPHFKIITQNH